MSTHKTKIDEKLVLPFLKENFSQSISNLEFIIGGEGSQAYSFNVDNEEFILRVNKNYAEGFRKDDYAHKNFSSSEIHIPKILKIGKIDRKNNYCISEKIKGETWNSLSKKNIESVNQDLMRILDNVHAVDVSNTIGYGKWGDDGNGKNASWRERLLRVGEYAYPLFEKSFLERDVWDKIYTKFIGLLEFCPEDRHLIHGDYGFNNILSDGKKITGVIDWENSMYGDPVFDVAWLSFWSKETDFAEIYLKTHRDITNFKERLLCYNLYVGLSSLSFFSFSDQKEKYEKAKERILKFF